jgi:DNA oxidative demethylase
MPAESVTLFDREPSAPEGFAYRDEIIMPAEERRLLVWFERLDFAVVTMHGVASRRRVVQFGWRYGFDRGGLQETAAIPRELLPLRARVAAWAGWKSGELTEALVTEYTSGATIGWHRDAPAFGLVAGVSLGSACRFRFRRGTPGSWQTYERLLAPRSAYLMTGAARAEWQHSIPAVRETRYSVTFRTVRRR